MIITRRSFLVGLLAAPIIVRPGILMPVKKIEEPGIVAGYNFGSTKQVICGVDEYGNYKEEVLCATGIGTGIYTRGRFREIPHIEWRNT